MPAERLVDALLTLEHASLEEHLRITFELLDTRGDGTIARENLEEILRVSSSVSSSARSGFFTYLWSMDRSLCRSYVGAQTWSCTSNWKENRVQGSIGNLRL